MQRRIAKYYRRESGIIYPPVASTQLRATPGAPDDYYLVVSRLVPYKRIDLAVRAFTSSGLPLRIIGDGRDRAALAGHGRAQRPVPRLPADDEVRAQMAGCRAFVFPGEEDFGITPLEAMAGGPPGDRLCRRRRAGYRRRGAHRRLFFREPTPESLAEAVRRLNPVDYRPEALRAHAERFSVPRSSARWRKLWSGLDVVTRLARPSMSHGRNVVYRI